SEGHKVHVMDDLSTGSIRNIESLKVSPNFSYTIDSIFNESLTAELVDDADVIFHLAAAVGVFQIVESPVRTIETNIEGTKVLLTQATKKKKPILIASTSEVYGKATELPFREDGDLILGPSTKGRWSYAASKLIDEFLALSYAREKKLPTIVVRLFNTVGPRQTGQYGMVVPRFVKQALDGGPITVYGDGEQSRCFGYVGDVVGGLVALTREPKAYGNVFNIGNDKEISITGLAEMIRAKVNPEIKIDYIPYDQAYEAGFEDMRRRIPDLTKIKELIGYEPKVHTEEIIDRVIDSIKSEG
ncbi:MAG: GDP-mannose 4,6-dehydratase, partial [Planctomycetota bacterium]|nr:GDP-mannose 4,6-dehydratase [Planctomycetota bacterium]